MKRKYVYKCVRVLYGENRFASVSPPSRKLNLLYRVNRWTKAYNGTPGIFVFTSLKEARRWSQGCVLKCEYFGEPLRLTRRMEDLYNYPTRFGLKSLVSIFSTPEKREKMIEMVNEDKFATFNCSAPMYTHVVNAVKPVKVAYPKKVSRLYRSYLTFTEGRGLPDWMDNKWRIKR